MIGKKFTKNHYNMEDYARTANWCNQNNATIVDQGEYYEVIQLPFSLDETKGRKIDELKTARDAAEVEPIEYSGNRYDYDDKARDRINAAIIALDGTTQTLSWTTADNTEAIVNAEDLKAIVRAVAVRSNELHTRYREKKEAVMQATNAEEVASIGW